MSEASDCGGQHLKERIQVFGLVVEMCGMGMNLRDVASKEVPLAVQLLINNITIHTTEEQVLRFDEQVSRCVPWSEG